MHARHRSIPFQGNTKTALTLCGPSRLPAYRGAREGIAAVTVAPGASASDRIRAVATAVPRGRLRTNDRPLIAKPPVREADEITVHAHTRERRAQTD
jgi:NAD(P)-dependent dehydrogenase (short-subunit alcohol dehydrogenase family)